MAKLNFQDNYSSLQDHMILQKYSNMLIWCSRNMLETAVLLSIFVETVIHFFFQYSFVTLI